MKIAVMLQSLIIKKTDRRIIQLFRYGAVSAASSAVDFAVLFALTEYLNLHYLASAGFAYCLGFIVNYLLSIRWVFHKKKLQNRAAEFIIFCVIGLLGMGLNELTLWFFTDPLGFHYMISRMISALIGFIWKYVLRKWILF